MGGSLKRESPTDDGAKDGSLEGEILDDRFHGGFSVEQQPVVAEHIHPAPRLRINCPHHVVEAFSAM
jgi:hypothetical protein